MPIDTAARDIGLAKVGLETSQDYAEKVHIP